MNSLTLYSQSSSLLRSGDLIMFWGTTPLSRGIELFAGGPSHSAIVRQPSIEGKDVKITESTRGILPTSKELNGVQDHYLGEEIGTYDKGGSVAALLLDDESRERMDWFKFYEAIGSLDGLVKYDTSGLFEMATKMITPVIGTRAWQTEKDKVMFCSAFVSAVLIKCGVLGHGINWSLQRPQDLVQAKIFKGWVPLLGQPKLKRFNTL